jgi:hypothetical protein
MDDGDEQAVEQTLLALLEELDGPPDDEHPDVAVTHAESGWIVSVFQSGLLVWENPDLPDPPRHMDGVSRETALRVMMLVAAGDLDAVESMEWRPGY